MMCDNHYLVGLDLGSSGMKGVVLRGGQIVAQQSAPMQYLREDKLCEYDADIYYSTAADLIRRLVSDMPADCRCAGIAVACASGNTLLLKHGRPLIPVISWRDSRGSQELETLFSNFSAEDIYHTCGWHKAPKFPLTQLSWLARCHPELLAKSDMICEGSCYINYRLCGQYGMDHSTATTFYLQNQSALQWDPCFLAPLHIRLEQLPPLVPSGARLGAVTAQAAAETGLPLGTPVAAGCYDGASVGRASGLLREGQLLISCGTSWVCGYPCKSRQKLLQMNTMIDPYLLEQNTWLGMTSLGEAGVYVNRALDQILPDCGSRIARFYQLASLAPAGSEGLLLNPMRLEQCGDLSRWDASTVCRAIMEGIVYSVKRQIQTVQQACPDYPAIQEVIMAGGPTQSKLWPQIVSDVLQLPVRVYHSSNTSAVGAAILAGLGSGVFSSVEDAFASIHKQDIKFLPDPGRAAIYREAFPRFQARFPGRDINMI